MSNDTIDLVAPVDPPLLASRVDAILTGPNQQHRHAHAVVGAQPSSRAVRMRSNDYLSIANDPRIIAAEIDVLRSVGHGDAISRIFLHREEDLHRAFEKRIARLTGAQDAVLCMSGYCANVGLLQAIATEGTQVYIDMRAHASLWQGITCARATARPFAHRDPEFLERRVCNYGPGILVVDSLYSTDGALCPLEEFIAVAERHGLLIVVDETHAFGTQGPRGEGLVAALGLAHRVHFRTIDEQGYNVDACDAQIIALEAGPLSEVVRLREALERRDVIGSVFCWPATPKDRTILRLTVNAGLSDEQIDHVIDACRDIREELGMASWDSVRRKVGLAATRMGSPGGCE